MINFEDLYDSYAQDVYRFSLFLSGDHDEAKDITSETFIRVWVRKNTVRTETLKAYLFMIARNVFLEKQRKMRRQVRLNDNYSDLTSLPENIVESRLYLSRIWVKLRTLPEIDRTVFTLRVLHDLPYEEIARMLGLSISTTKVKVHRIRKKMLGLDMDKEVN